jgi:hypothetical protein
MAGCRRCHPRGDRGRRWRYLDHIFMAVSIGMMTFGLFSLPGLFLRSGYGTRQRSSAARAPTADASNPGVDNMATRKSVMVAGIKRESAHRWKVFGVGVAANASFTAAVQGIPTTAVWLRSDYHLSTAELGLAFGSMGLGLALSELPWGMLTDRWGDRPVLLTGLLSAAAMLVAMAWLVAPSTAGVPALGWLVSAMCLVGLLGGSGNGSSGRAVMAWFRDDERGLAMSIRQTAIPLGGGLGALTLPWLDGVSLGALCRWIRQYHFDPRRGAGALSGAGRSEHERPDRSNSGQVAFLRKNRCMDVEGSQVLHP